MKSDKSEKKFVRYTNFADPPPPPRDSKKVPHKKAYTEKGNTKNRECLREMFESFTLCKEIPPKMRQLIELYPYFFKVEPKSPLEDTNQNLNEYLCIPNPRVTRGTQNHATKNVPDNESSDAPDWNSDEDTTGTLISRQIDTQLKEKIADKLAGLPPKNKELLKRYEVEFLEDHFRGKRLADQKQAKKKKDPAKEVPKEIPKEAPKEASKEVSKEVPKEVSKEAKKSVKPTNQEVPLKKQKNEPQTINQSSKKASSIWSEYQQKQVSSLVDSGLMIKIDENDEMYGMLLGDSNDQLENLDFSEDEKKASSSDEDDTFRDDDAMVRRKEQPTTQMEPAKSTVYIVSQTFTEIAESVGLSSVACRWVLTNLNERYMVTTEYMDRIYRKEKVCDALPYISLNNSQFVHNDEVDTGKGLQVFKKCNLKREVQQPSREKRTAYKEKGKQVYQQRRYK